MNDRQAEEFERPRSAISPSARRVSAVSASMRSSSRARSAGAAYHHPPSRLDQLGLPPVLKDVAMTKRGLVIIRRRHRHRQIDHAGGDDRLPQQELLRPHHHHRRPGRNTCTSTRTASSPSASRRRHRTWHAALKTPLRQAPDVILIGEIRDRETMDYAIAFAETGHLCMATLHANSANQALTASSTSSRRAAPASC